MKKLIWVTLMLLSVKGQTLTFENAIDLAIKNDQQLTALGKQAEAWQANSEGIAYWPNPSVNLGLMNVAADGFDLGQENMSMAQVKVTQRLPKKKWVNIKKQQAIIQSERQNLLQKDREALLQQQAGTLWLQIHWAQTKLQLLQQQKAWLKQLSQTVTNHYQSGSTQTQQADVLQVELAANGIEQQLIETKQQQQHAALSLGVKTRQNIKQVLVDETLPEIEPSEIQPNFKLHPKVQVAKKQAAYAELAISSVNENNKSNWVISTAYGHRQDNNQGLERADLASIGISFDIPLFNRKHNNSKVRQAALQADAQHAKWQQVLLDFNNQWVQALNQYRSQRQLYQLHQSQLIPQNQSVIDALMIAYSNGRSDIDAVLKAHQELINQQLNAVSAQHQFAISGLTLNYLQTTNMPGTKSKGAQNE
ncbi:TolC family protein [Marinicella rhabdoformis]|uniref:TolC family protein n=1 Tax=Marinicella rhabdoformis TaxID=2580566 RepID=UPI0012AEC331|nr:TolC family protein [Marinicella rhabdoformis]